VVLAAGEKNPGHLLKQDKKARGPETTTRRGLVTGIGGGRRRINRAPIPSLREGMSNSDQRAWNWEKHGEKIKVGGNDGIHP